MRRWRWWILAGVVGAALALLGALPALGFGRLPLAATVLPARDAATWCAVAAGVVLLAVALVWRNRPVRRGALPLGIALALAAATSVPVVLQRGSANAPPADGGDLRILSWNVNGDLVPAATIARLAVAERADVVVLPESSTPNTADGDVLVPTFSAAGLDVVELPQGQPGTTTTTVLVRRALGSYALAADRSPEPDRSAVLTTPDPDLPRIVAIHAVVPSPRSTPVWAADLDWAAAQCTDPNTVVVGDFNTSIDGFGSARLGGCTDAASQVAAASVGSWPTWVPTWLGMPIDHVLTGRDWRTRSFTVLTGEDGSGARHRPVLAVLDRR